MTDWRLTVARTTLIGAAILGVVGLALGAYVGFIYGGLDFWYASLLAGVETSLIGGVLGAIAGFVYVGLRASLCRKTSGV